MNCKVLFDTENLLEIFLRKISNWCKAYCVQIVSEFFSTQDERKFSSQLFKLVCFYFVLDNDDKNVGFITFFSLLLLFV